MIPRLTAHITPAAIYLQFLKELEQGGFEGERSARYADRTVLATDNSIYQIWPQCVVFPRHRVDLVRLMSLASEERFREIKLAPRGGGTGTNGQSLSEGLVVDVSRHMNRILEIDVENRWVRVEAGVVKDQLNRALAPYGLFFAPELSTSNRATIGGMVNTDASGQGSVRYGKTRDHVLELDTILLGGSSLQTKPLAQADLAAAKVGNDSVSTIYRAVDALHHAQRDLIVKHFPPLNRCLTGYDLAHLRDEEGRFDLNSILCGSEGTLGLVAEAKLNVLPVPHYSAIFVVRYDSFDASLRDANTLMALQPASIETVDGTVLRLARGDSSWLAVKNFFPDDGHPVEGINLVEYIGWDKAEFESRLEDINSCMSDRSLCAASRLGHTLARGEAEVKSLWNMRKRAVGLLGNMEGTQRPVPFVEDTAVPPENLADYIAEFRALLDRRELKYGMFGHVDAGVLHVRPALDLTDPSQEHLIREISDEVVALTAKYHGLLWGEHGKGVRSEYSPVFFGPLYPALQAIKALFDPHNQLNPGKIASPAVDGLLKIDQVPTRGSLDRQIPIAVRREYANAVNCNGNGACYNFDADDSMCPSWKVTRQRRHSPKGRASLLREWLRQLQEAGVDEVQLVGGLQFQKRPVQLVSRTYNTIRRMAGEYDFSHEVMEAMQGCLACKACVGQCPVKVDVPDFRSKFLHHYHERYIRPLKDYFVGALESSVPLFARAGSIYNALSSGAIGRKLMGVIGLVDTPKVSTINLQKELARRGFEPVDIKTVAAKPTSERESYVVVVQDAFTSYFDPLVVVDLFELLRTLGFRPILAPYLPNGKALHVHGFLRAFHQTASRNAKVLRAWNDVGVSLIGVDPSMTLTYRMEYKKALSPDACPIVELPQEWLAKRIGSVFRPGKERPVFRLFPHCTERTNAPALLADWKRVFELLGATLEVENVGCCGMAGTFGHERKHQQESRGIYELSWSSRIRIHDVQNLIGTGYSCRCQVERFDGHRPPHPVQVLLHLARATGSTTYSLSSGRQKDALKPSWTTEHVDDPG